MSMRVDTAGEAGRRIIGFPNPVNEKAARTVAGGVLLMCSATLALSLTGRDHWLWLTVPIALGFIARVLSGPRLSPLGQVATKIIAPRLGKPRLVPGPPKRFAQGIGSVVTVAAVVVLALGQQVATQALLGLMIVAAGLEATFAFCIGCRVFAGLMRLGVIPRETCEACTNVSFELAEPRVRIDWQRTAVFEVGNVKWLLQHCRVRRRLREGRRGAGRVCRGSGSGGVGC